MHFLKQEIWTGSNYRIRCCFNAENKKQLWPLYIFSITWYLVKPLPLYPGTHLFNSSRSYHITFHLKLKFHPLPFKLVHRLLACSHSKACSARPYYLAFYRGRGWLIRFLWPCFFFVPCDFGASRYYFGIWHFVEGVILGMTGASRQVSSTPFLFFIFDFVFDATAVRSWYLVFSIMAIWVVV